LKIVRGSTALAEARRTAPRDQLDGQFLPERANSLAAEQSAQPPRSLGAAQGKRLPDGAELEKGRGLDVIEADDRQLAGHRHAQPFRHSQDANGLSIGRSEDCRWRIR
jgi:hypothetical protein